jgi:membrane protein implicated in regulation of membrane protease activity
MALVVAVLCALLFLDPPWSYLAVIGGASVEIGESAFWIHFSRRRRPHVGAETLVGLDAVVVLPCRPNGQVRVNGELWQARCDAGADPGDRVRVGALEGLTLVVERD